jgi:PEP-CTERM motif
MTLKTMALTGIAALALTLGASSGARADLVTNGSFEMTTAGPGQLGFNTDATGWSTNGYNFLFAAGTSDNVGANGQFGNLALWGPNNGSANGLPASSPDGGNFVAADGAFQVGAITQTINGLTAGDVYAVSFYWAGAQQRDFTGDTTEQWVVGFGSGSQSTAVVNNASHGFTGWQQETFFFAADGPSDVLSFLAVGTPNGVPPFSLLDGVSVRSVPEPSAILLMGLGLVGVGIIKQRRRAKAVAV